MSLDCMLVELDNVPTKERLLEPLYNCAVAAILVPMPSKAALTMFLNNHKVDFPTVRYTDEGPGSYQRHERLLTMNEIYKLRSMYVKESPVGKSEFNKAWDIRRSRYGTSGRGGDTTKERAEHIKSNNATLKNDLVGLLTS